MLPSDYVYPSMRVKKKVFRERKTLMSDSLIKKSYRLSQHRGSKRLDLINISEEDSQTIFIETNLSLWRHFAIYK
jgi:hypothetical protein